MGNCLLQKICGIVRYRKDWGIACYRKDWGIACYRKDWGIAGYRKDWEIACYKEEWEGVLLIQKVRSDPLFNGWIPVPWVKTPH
jgi:hypothetical protein